MLFSRPSPTLFLVIILVFVPVKEIPSGSLLFSIVILCIAPPKYLICLFPVLLSEKILFNICTFSIPATFLKSNAIPSIS